MPPKRDPASILDAIIERAPRLHAAGIKSLSFEGLSVELDAPNPPAGLDAPVLVKGMKPTDLEEPPADEADPLNDRATYGGGRVPGFTRPKKEQM